MRDWIEEENWRVCQKPFAVYTASCGHWRRKDFSGGE